MIYRLWLCQPNLILISYFYKFKSNLYNNKIVRIFCTSSACLIYFNEIGKILEFQISNLWKILLTRLNKILQFRIIKKFSESLLKNKVVRNFALLLNFWTWDFEIKKIALTRMLIRALLAGIKFKYNRII